MNDIIAQAFLSAARTAHPDVAGGSQARFIALSKAKESLNSCECLVRGRAKKLTVFTVEDRIKYNHGLRWTPSIKR